MTETSLSTYHELEQVLGETDLKLHVSQAHGLICGLLCGQPESNPDWKQLVTGGKKSEKAHKVLQHLFEASRKQLADFLFELQLILPADSQELMIRAEALTLWCQGFLTGLKIVNIAIVNRKPSEMTEAINDLIAIAKMNYEEVVTSEEDEAAYTELVEFVRVAVILIYQDTHENVNPASSSRHLH